MPDPNRATVCNIRSGRDGCHHWPDPGCHKPGVTIRCINAQHCGYCPECGRICQFIKGCMIHKHKKGRLLRFPPKFLTPPSKPAAASLQTSTAAKDRSKTKQPTLNQQTNGKPNADLPGQQKSEEGHDKENASSKQNGQSKQKFGTWETKKNR